MRDFLRRLERLETAINESTPAHPGSGFPVAFFQAAVLAVFRGQHQEEEAIAEAHGRALGYETHQAYKQAVVSGAWLDRHNAVWADFCAACGVGPDVTADVQLRFLEYVLQGVPERVRQRLQSEFESKAPL